MRKWIVQETGEVRTIGKGEYYHAGSDFLLWEPTYLDDYTLVKYPVLSVNLVPTREAMISVFESLMKKADILPDEHGYFLRKTWFLQCYDMLFPHQPGTSCVLDLGDMTKEERREWIYGTVR